MVEIPFSFFCSLLREIAKIQPRKASNKYTQNQYNNYPAIQVFRRWISELHKQFSPVPLGTVAACFRLLFPELDVNRKYDMQECRLAQNLADCLAINHEKLGQWDADNSLGCLGLELRSIMEKMYPYEGGDIGPLSIADVDTLLDELASNSGYSHTSIRQKFPHGKRRPRITILRSLYCDMPPLDASFLTQIILKDLRPILYPLQEIHYRSALIDYKSNSVQMLKIEHAMNTWDPSGWFLKTYRVRSDMDQAAAMVETPEHMRKEITPQVGCMVKIPKSQKGRGSFHTLGYMRDSAVVWAETKYDGERAQIHVEILPDKSSRIRIFSKSGRDSTLDRQAVHEVIRNTLGLADSTSPFYVNETPRVNHNVILDAELVPWNGTRIDEYWRLRALISNTAHGIRGIHKNVDSGRNQCSQDSMLSDASESRNLALVFFDVLLLDSASLLSTPYFSRRNILETLVRPIRGQAMLSERFPVDMRSENPEAELTRIFAEHISDHQEGVVVKAEDSCYNDYQLPWVKLKRDYIEGYGDCLDLVIVGAGWEKARARELRVAPNTFTTFYLGALKNARDVRENSSTRPHFLIYFTTSYGLNREQLEDTNFVIKNSDPVVCQPSMTANIVIDLEELPYTFTMFSGLELRPSVLLRKPLVAEVYGAGFTKAAGSIHYELRFPRISKVFHNDERVWEDSVCLDDLHQIARGAVGRNRLDKDIYDSMNALWGKPVSPNAKCSMKRKAVTELWEEKLVAWDHGLRRGKEGSSSQKRRQSGVFKVVKINLSPPALPELLPLSAKTNLASSRHTATVNCSSQKGTRNSENKLVDMSQEAQISNSHKTPKRKTFQYLPTPLKSESKPKVIAEIDDTVKGGEGYLDGAVVWFAIPRGKQPQGSSTCASCLLWRKAISRERVVHSLESLLIGCGWDSIGGNIPEWLKRGVIIVDDSNEVGRQWKASTLATLQERKLRGLSGERRAVCVINCCVDTSKQTLCDADAEYVLSSIY